MQRPSSVKAFQSWWNDFKGPQNIFGMFPWPDCSKRVRIQIPSFIVLPNSKSCLKMAIPGIFCFFKGTQMKHHLWPVCILFLVKLYVVWIMNLLLFMKLIGNISFIFSKTIKRKKNNIQNGNIIFKQKTFKTSYFSRKQLRKGLLSR